MHRILLAPLLAAALALLVAPRAATAVASEPPKSDSAAEEAAPTNAPVVYTTFYPTAYFAKRIGGRLIRVENPCPPDADPAFWMPDAATIAAYQKADLIVINGAQFEKWVEKATLPKGKVVDTTRPLKDDLIVIKDATSHSHGAGPAHTHDGVDGHTWLDPQNAKVQAQQIRDALIKLAPQHKEPFERNFMKLAADLDVLDTRLKVVADKLKDAAFIGNHPAWNYLARRYGLKIRSFSIDPDAELDAATLAELKTAARELGARNMLWESEPAEPVAAKLAAELGVRHIVFSPVESISPPQAAAGEDYFKLMSANIDRLGAAISRG